MATLNRIFFVAILLVGLGACKDDITPPPSPPATINKFDTITNFQGLLVPTTGKLKVNINYSFGDAPLELNTKYFNTLGGDTFVLTLVRHYLSNFTLIGEEGKANLGNYQLMNFTDLASRSFTLSGVPAGVYQKLGLIVGVDSLRNGSGLQEGALDPGYGMFWTWATGYIFFKLEGRTNKEVTFGFHPGGSRVTPYNEVDLSTYKVKSVEPSITLTLDIKKMLESPYIYNLDRDGYNIHSSADPSNDKILGNMKNMVKLNSITQ